MGNDRTVKSLGVDIGQKQDPPAMVLSERMLGKRDVRVTKVAQLPLQMPYPVLVHTIETVAHEADIVVLDGTGVGAPIYDFCRDTIPHCWAAVVTGGKNTVVNFKHQTIHIPKVKMVETIVRMVEKDQLKIRPGDHVHKLLEELRNLQRTQTQLTVRYGAKSGKHDDLVMALANSLLGFGLMAKYMAAESAA